MYDRPMCGRFSQAESSRRLAKVFGAYADENLPEPRYNVAPSLGVRVVLEKDGERRLTGATWGFAPPTDPAAARARSWINARAETALESPIFGPALRARRCLIPADAFYEWDGAGGVAQPYAIGPARADEPMALAGIWTPARAAPPTMAILTTGANGALRPLHHRMPVIVAPREWDRWLDATLDGGLLTDLLAPAPDESIRVWPVATAVNRADNEGPELLAPVEPQPTLGLV
jgi:putative SOS response-associated peptidase YedK